MTRTSDDDSTFLGDADAPTGRQLVAVWQGGMLSMALPVRGTVVIGRSTECDVRIDHRSMSRKHLALRLREAIEVSDLESANGTRVRGELLAPGRAVAVGPGEVIEAGSVFLSWREGAAKARAGAGEARAPAAAGVVVIDPAMGALYETVSLVARGDITVLLLGETGAGKEIVAHEVHRRSPRSAAPFVTVNCAALPETLFESELFGYERGAFTGAARAKGGLLEAAEGGTVFFDEIGELPLGLQAKLLRVLERHEVTRLGASKPQALDARFVFATNRDLMAMVRAGTFRQDLFFRVSGVTLTVPPLRERPGEVLPLATRFVGEARAKLGAASVTLTAAASRALCAYDWPGNVRELKNVAGRAALLCGEGPIDVAHLGLTGGDFGPPTIGPAPPDAGDDDPERRRILAALARCGGNQSRAAKELGISRRQLVYRLDEYDVPRPLKGR